MDVGVSGTANCVDSAVDVGVAGVLSTMSSTLMDANNSSAIVVLRRSVPGLKRTVVAEWAGDCASSDCDRLMTNICAWDEPRTLRVGPSLWGVLAGRYR